MTWMGWWATVGALAVLGLAGCKRDKPPDPDPDSVQPIPTGVAVTKSARAQTPGEPTAPAPTAEHPLRLGSLAPMSFAPIAKQADPSVVTVLAVGDVYEPTMFRGIKERRKSSALGSGFIVDKDGLVLTNDHVVSEGEAVDVKISVKLANDKIYPARIVGKDKRTDLAVLKIDEHDLTPLALGDSDAIEVGDWVVAIGNPFGLSHSVSVGILSAKERTRDDLGGKNAVGDPTGYYSLLQTDASINQGNSGGPLLNLKGEVVGINNMIRDPRSGAQGICFAIPINMVKQLLPMLVRDGHVTRSALGIGLVDNSTLTAEEKVALKLTTGREAIVGRVTPGGPADKAHLAPEDVILAFDGTPVEKSTQLQWLASTAGVGKTVTLKVSRDGKVFEAHVTLGELAEPARPDR
jgi:serine protease Do